MSLQMQGFIQFVLLLINAIHLKNGDCVTPEASQEGPLRSFKTHKDIVIFQYNVPKEVLRATWQFSAFMDNKNCPPRTVNIFLKWGSYPAINVNNATYPTQMYLENNTIQITTITAFEPKSMTIIPVYSPEPGDWFVGAHLSSWDESVHQKGIGRDCHYSLGSVGVWSETSNINSIPLDYQISIRTIETISYYKIYIPMNTWTFKVDIWDCNFTLKSSLNMQNKCIKNLSLKARSLPHYNHSNLSSFGRITSMDKYTFTELFPFQDSWYYLMVVSESAISFSVKVTTFECPVRTLGDTYTRRYMHAPIYHTSSEKFHDVDSQKSYFQSHSMNRSNILSKIIFENQSLSDFVGEERHSNSCIPRYRLVRIQNPQTFSRDFLLRGRDWLTSWVALTDAYPIITQFDILPLIDIGGSLEINLNLELDKSQHKQQVAVDICISRGRVPKQLLGYITCDNMRTTIKLSTSGVYNSSLLIPYPQPDTWYIALQAICYVNGIKVHCEMEEILLSLSVKLQACIFKGRQSCGQYGVCQEIQKGLFIYTACECFAGHQGLACTDSSNAISKISILLETLGLTLSNLAFMPAIYLAFIRKFYTEGFIYTCTMLFSAFYHACDQQSISFCVAKYNVLQYCDFFSGILAFWVTFVTMAGLPVQYISTFHMMGVIIITFGVESDKNGLASSLIPIVIGVAIPLCSYTYDCYKKKKISRPKRPIKLLIGLCLAGCGVLLFSLIETESNYKKSTFSMSIVPGT
ncbi:post-GPI attachment to proteins factor 6-like isoform X3 [Phymastichus coffea]|uniref:post-GPI attachment to proteins factor 6-like isoform X3 n=1 Tax=Phymastichus coffea TaxID=108790 RepID=UPI00273A8307|nr:post-GPI attachment to proteins factor 6-like isoform X3 [Phymastichus coffea]